MKTSNPLKLRVSLACLQYSLAVYILFVRQVILKMTGNANYSTPTPPLVDVDKGVGDLQTKAEAAHGGGRTAMAARDASWDASIMQVRSLANYVQLNCENDLTILLSSGFLSTKTPVPVGPLPAPENLRASYNGASGQLYLRFNRVLGVTAGYTIQQAESQDGPYVEIANHSKTKFLVKGLTPAKTYWFRVCANGTVGPSGWSNPVTAIAI